MLLIVIGLFNGFKHDFKNPTWFILILIGTVFLSGRLIPGFDLRAYVWPMAIIAVGIWLIVRRNHKHDFGRKKKAGQMGAQPNVPEADYIVKPDGTTEIPNEPFINTENASYNNIPKSDDYIDSVSVFGGIKRIVLSKDFKGGEIINVFGGSEIDFTRADINGTILIEVTQIFGGIKLIVPPHWQVQSDMAAVFAGIDDKRFGNVAAQSSDKVLILKGVSIFAGVDVRSF